MFYVNAVVVLVYTEILLCSVTQLVTGYGSTHDALNTVIMCPAVEFFSKLNYYFLGYFDPINIFFDNKNKSFSG